MLLPPPTGGRPSYTERPHRVAEHRVTHHVADPEPSRIADRDKAGRPRAPHPYRQPPARPATRTRLTLRTSTDTEHQRPRRDHDRPVQDREDLPPTAQSRS